MKTKGKISLVGSGPGELGLLTVRGAELLRGADVVVCPPAVNSALLELVAAAAEILSSGTGDGAPSDWDPTETVLTRAREGKSVVWLAAGDNPEQFGVSPDALARGGVVVEVVPGVASTASTRYAGSHKQPLAGQRVIVTRARQQAGQLAQQLADLGAQVSEIHTIKIAPPDDKEPLKDALMSFGEYDWLVFTSPNGVTTFFDYFLRGFEDLRAVGGVRIAAVGPGTAARIKELHLRVDVMPEENLARNIAAAINKYETVENLKILIARAEVANPELPKALEELGAIVDDVPIYKTIPETEDRTGAARRLRENGADWVTFTSGSTVESFHQRFNLPELLKKFPSLKLASIGPETTKAIAALGLLPTVEARQHNLEGLVHAMARYSAP